MPTEDDTQQTARLFTNGRSQAVRIPRAFEFEGVKEVTMRREGNKLVIEPKRKSWTSFPSVDATDEDDFLRERHHFDPARVRF